MADTTGKIALVTGVTGQDGSYLAEFLLEKGYVVHGIKRRSSLFNTQRVDHLYEESDRFFLHYGDLTDTSNIIRVIQDVKPHEVYNLGAQSHVKVSFESPEYTADVVGLGALRILEGIRLLGLENHTKFYQASSSELFGEVQETPQRETTPFYPRSPYACAKCFAYWTTVNYREAYDMFACNGLLFNHESPRRGETFVTRKITRAAARIAVGLEETLALGNLDAKRDWGHAKDYVKAQWLMLQQDTPDDFVIATGTQHSVRDFCNYAFAVLGVSLRWKGSGLDEKGIVDAIDESVLLAPLKEINALGSLEVGAEVVSVDPRYFRPTEVDTLIGDPTKAREQLGWEPEVTFEQLCREMVLADLDEAVALAVSNNNAGSVADTLRRAKTGS